jgi:hypothetical protein
MKSHRISRTRKNRERGSFRTFIGIGGPGFDKPQKEAEA